MFYVYDTVNEGLHVDNVTLAYTDTVNDDRFTNAVGSLSAPELLTSGRTYGIDGITALSSSGFFEKKGVYGTLKVHKLTGVYVFTPNDRAIESLKANTTESFVVTARDAFSQSQADVVIDISAEDDAVSVSANTAKVLEKKDAKVSGTIKLTDRDDVLGSAPVVAQTNSATAYGFFTIKANGQWSYLIDNNNATAMSLIRGQTLTENINITTALSGETVQLSITIIGQGGLGTVGHDRLIGNAFDEQLFGYAGNDTLDGGGGDDTMVGSLGNDTYVVDSEADVIIELFNEGLDNIQLAIASPTVVFDMATKAEHVEFLMITSQANQDVSGNDWHNQITGNGKDNLLSGMLGNDTLIGGAGNDTLDGGDGDDVLRGEAGVDVLIGGVGDDQYFVSLVRDVNTGVVSIEDTVTEFAGEGTDTLTLGYVNKLGAHYSKQYIDMPDEVEHLTVLISGYTKTSNYVVFRGNTLDNKMLGDASANHFMGDDGNDQMYGGAGQDTLEGGNGDDLLSGQQGIDELFGGLGQDTLYGGDQDDVLWGEDGDDLLYGDTGNDELNTGTGNNAAFGGAGNDLVYGDLGDDQLYGDDGNDLLFAGAGDDTISGGRGSDVIQAGDGDDVIYLDNGKELMSGGAGNDTFVFTQKPLVAGTVFKSNSHSFTLDFTTKVLYEKSILSLLDHKYYEIGTLNLGATVDYRLFYSQKTGGLVYETHPSKPLSAYFNNPTILDFVVGEDVLQFDVNVFTGLSDVATQFRAGSSNTATSSTDRLIYNQVTGDLFYDVDGSGSQPIYHVITLQGQPLLTASDIVLV